jgi:hypothetical protein
VREIEDRARRCGDCLFAPPRIVVNVEDDCRTVAIGVDAGNTVTGAVEEPVCRDRAAFDQRPAMRDALGECLCE